ncbi:MAG: glutathione S-transferase N-terminal domain-containing protein [Gammaproteobacteria bacterium]|nr:glutathione S-transferase N-terminal domain-containing protein [Gammaproteobacteria bacterium]
MESSSSRHGAITIYSGEGCPFSHRARLVLAEKGVKAELRLIDPAAPPSEALYELSPYGDLPVLVDRDLVIYESQIIMEYLDERFPHPPLMPVDPVSRANAKLMLYRINRDWFQLVKSLRANDAAAKAGRQAMRDGLSAIAPLLTDREYILGDQYTLVDCALAALLWQLPSYGVKLPARGVEPLLKYAAGLFRRETFRASLTELEQDRLVELV